MATIRRPAVAVPVALVALAGCGGFGDPGPQTSQERSLGEFTAVELHTGGELVVTAGDAPTLTVTAGTKVIDRLTSDVRDGVLDLDLDGSGRLGDVRYDLVVPRLEALSLDGSGKATVTDVPADDLRLTIAGSGGVVGSGLDVATLVVRVSGSGDVELDGRADDQEVGIEGSGAYRADRLASRTATVSVEGSGGVAVRVSDRLDVSISGSGDVVYSGDPAVESSIDGSGAVRAQ